MEITGTSWFARLHKSVRSVSGWFEVVGMVALMAMVLAALIDVVGSKGFRWPLPGGTEITGVLQVVAIAAGLAFSKLGGSHIQVGFLIARLSGRSLAALNILIALLSLGLWVVAGWMTLDLGLSLFHRGTETMLLGIPHYPFAFWIALSCIPISFVIILDLITSIDKVKK
ncbi:MAG TPA: TRAP transporter small permease [Dehalococcoidales bacterium]|nr:MAG: hypothetical protein A2Z05_00230 [Chloroflexi bacterium RBG_16_60_22]HJX13565.1 TRAP transporter small permease [Dehalococcoidales bacterium]